MTARSPAFAERMGVLMATGLIVGESLMGVVYAFAVAARKRRDRRTAPTCSRWSRLIRR